ncbi:MAG TPA: DUF5696 domain-containing protein, partial [Clostridia bacterium]|nr:DUF5696 domain-containing protein [Clostridia bacterium]
KDKGMNIMLTGCNEYLLKYADVIAEAPTSNTGYFVADETVPFYQMVLHGYIPYIASPLNQAADEEIAFLRAVEMGAGLSYVWMYADNSELKNVNYEIGYSLNYERWMESAISKYKRANEAIGHLTNKLIVDHYRPIAGKEVTVTVYEDGTKVIVNFTDMPVQVDNKVVPSKDFIVVS